MKNLFLEHHTLPFEKQCEIYQKTIEEWMQNSEQTDDILLIGFKV